MRQIAHIGNRVAAVALFFCFAACGSSPLDGLAELGEAQYGMSTDQDEASEAVFGAKHTQEMAILDLSMEQQAQIEALKAEMQEDLADELALMEQLKTEMAALWTVEQPDRQAILDKHAEMAVVREQIVERRFAFRVDIIALLSDEQRAVFAETAGPCAQSATCNGGHSGRDGRDGMSGDRGDGDCGGRDSDGRGELGMSADQRSQITALKAEMQEDLAEVIAELGQLKIEICGLWAEQEPDVEAILAKRSEIQPYRQEILARRVDFRLAVFELLTPEQQADLVDRINSRQEGRSGSDGGRC